MIAHLYQNYVLKNPKYIVYPNNKYTIIYDQFINEIQNQFKDLKISSTYDLISASKFSTVILLLVKTHISEATFIDFFAISSADILLSIKTFEAAKA